ncbi:hypothetical protein ACIBCM_19335 [Streptomyces sp. NPDC051018]|uniref:hypothetical protein n=1 Tax=Streptomyces sp. NPDC051018 TaxID=3365639 RepID=UPI003793EAEC
MNLRSSWVAETGQTREDTRLTQIGATTPQNTLEARSGILAGSNSGQYRASGFSLDGGTAAMSATLNPGRAVIQGQSGQGVYPVALASALTLVFAPGDAQFGRIDLVVLRVYDSLYDSSNRHEAVAEIIQGTPAQTPVPPATPPLSLPLYEVMVPATASAGTGGINWNTSLRDLRTSIVALGGILPVLGEIRPGAYPGQYQDSGGSLQRWDGSAWVPYPSALGGIAPAGALGSASYTGQYRDTAGGVLQRWNGTAWLPAVPGPAFNATDDGGYTTSLTYTPTLVERTANPLTLTFTAPASRSVLISYGSRVYTAASDTATAYMSLRVTRGATVDLEPNDNLAVVYSGSVAASVSSVMRLHSLIPGTSYTLTALHRSSNAGVRAWFDGVYLRVDAQT